MACLSEGPRVVAEAVALGPNAWPSVWCTLGSFVQPHPGLTHCSGECIAQAPVVGEKWLPLVACPAVIKAGSFPSPGKAVRYGAPSSPASDLNRARLNPGAFPYSGETDLALCEDDGVDTGPISTSLPSRTG